jgi:3-oxoacyl-[acyl-carrier protein] reductase
VNLGLEDKVAWVMGGSSGLGRASATAIAAEGGRVAVSSRDEQSLKQTASEIAGDTGATCIAVPLDVTDRDAILDAARRVAAELGSVDILVSNAGGPPPGRFTDVDDETLLAAFALTTASAWRLTKAVVPTMLERGSGVLVYLTSGSTKEYLPNLLLSNMLRPAVVGMMKTISKELGPQGVRALCVAPGRIETKRLQQLDEAAAERAGTTVEEVRAKLQATIPLGRYGEPREFGDVVAFLASERASFVTGVSVVVDGGMLSGILT